LHLLADFVSHDTLFQRRDGTMTSKLISIELDAKQQAMLRQQLDSGRYDNASEVMSDALRLMSERDAIFSEWLRDEVRASIADKRAPAPIDEVFKRVRAKIARTAKAASEWPA
jgi:antitoxin ParD1/3/4